MVQVSCMISVERWARLCSYHEGFLSSVGGEGKQVTKLDGLIRSTTLEHRDRSPRGQIWG